MRNFRKIFSDRVWAILLSAFFGYLIAGPAGALLGIIIGNFFGRSLIRHYTGPYWHYRVEKQKEVRKVFFEATFLLMGYIAKSDGRISVQEINVANLLMREMGLHGRQIREAQRLFTMGKHADFDLDRVLMLLQSACANNPPLFRLFLDIQYRAAKAGGFSDRKIEALNKILQTLGFAALHKQYRFYEDFFTSTSSRADETASSYQRHQYQSPQSTLAQAYTILNVSQQASKQEVKNAYRRLISRNHPDRLIAKGLPEAAIKEANTKTQNIRKAYELICASKGW